jgi:hypothetical protein
MAINRRQLICLGVLLLTCSVGGLGNAQQIVPKSQSIPFQLEDNLIRVPVSIDGHTASAVLDSGTGALVLDRKFALSIGLTPGAALGDAPGGGGPSAMFSLKKIEDLSFGPEHLTSLQGIAIDLAHIRESAGFPVDALLGQPVFISQPVRIDYPKRTITFLPPDQPVACADPIKFSMTGGTPVIAVTLQATSTDSPHILHLIVDLGTRHNIAIIGGPFLSSSEGKTLLSQSHPQQIGTGTGGSMQGHITQIKSLTLGQQSISLPSVALTSDLKLTSLGIADGTLGVPTWVDGVITFDYAHSVLCLDLPSHSQQ